MLFGGKMLSLSCLLTKNPHSNPQYFIMEKSEKFKIGDVVTLNSGSIQFTISSTNGEFVSVIWYNETKSTIDSMSSMLSDCFTKVDNIQSDLV